MDKKWEKVLRDYDAHCLKVAKAATININELPADKLRRIKGLEADYIAWFEYYFKHYAKCKSAKFHREMAEAITGNPKVKFLGEIYRSGAKSTHIDMGIPLYLMVTGKMKFMVLLGETDLKAKILISDIQAELQYNPRFLNDYGKLLKYGDWSSGNFSTTTGVRFYSLGFGQSPRGLREGADRPDYIVVDDVDSKKHVNSDRIMREAVDYILEDLMGCFDASDNSTERFVYANNNFHKNSITNRLKKEFEHAIKQDKEDWEEAVKRHERRINDDVVEGGEELLLEPEPPKLFTTNYSVLSVPAVKDLVSFEPTWPEKTTADYWRKKYKKRRRSFLREYMHMHVEEGKIFTPETFQWKEMLLYELYDALVVYGDMSYKEQGDFKGLVLLGKIGRELHIMHIFLRQTTRRLAAAWLYDLYEDKGLADHNIHYQIEGLFAQDDFLNDFDVEGDDRGYHIPVTADKRPKGEKFDRIESTEGYFQRRWVWYNASEKDSTDQTELRDQYLAFEKGSQAHDDGPDCVHGAIDAVNRLAFVEGFDARIAQYDNYGSSQY